MDFQWTRRQFCRNLVVFTGGVMAHGAMAADAGASGAWVALGPASKFAPGSVTAARLPGAAGSGQAYVVSDAAGTRKVFSAKCTHRGCPLSWNGGTKQFECPCHGGKFDTAGHVVSGPPRRPLDEIPSRTDPDGQLSIRVS